MTATETTWLDIAQPVTTTAMVPRGPCATDTGIAIDPGTAAACDGPVIVPDADGVYRQQRYPTAATRRLLARRDPTCRFPDPLPTWDGHRLDHHWIAACLAQPTAVG